MARLVRACLSYSWLAITLAAFVLVTASYKMLTPSFMKLLANLSIPIITKPWDIDHLLKAVASAAASITDAQSG